MYSRCSQRVDVSARGNDGGNPLSWACSGGHHQVVEYLLKYDHDGADAQDVDGWASLA